MIIILLTKYLDVVWFRNDSAWGVHLYPWEIVIHLGKLFIDIGRVG